MALKLGKLVEEGMPGVKVVYTRTADRTLGGGPGGGRPAGAADIANKAGGDLFISIHANAAPRATGVRGVETLIMGEIRRSSATTRTPCSKNNREDLIDMSDERTAAIVRAYIQNLQFTYGEYSMAFRPLHPEQLPQGGPPFARHKAAAAAVALCDGHAGRADRDRVHVQPAGTGLHEVRQGGQNEIARSLYQAIRNYSAYVLGTRMAEEEQALPRKPAAEQPAEKSAGKAAERSVEKPAAKSAEKTAAAPPEGKTATAARSETPGETGRTAPALYDSGDGFGVVRAPRLGAVPRLPRQ